VPQIDETKNAREIGFKGSARFIWHPCEGCGKERWVILIKGEPSFSYCCQCTNGKLGASNSRWKGGRYKHPSGYVYIYLYSGDFFYWMANHQGYVLEHRLVMARHLGRNLQPWEVIHHKNGIRDDNRLENLRLTTDLGNKQIHYFETKLNQLLGENKNLRQEIGLLQLELRRPMPKEGTCL